MDAAIAATAALARRRRVAPRATSLSPNQRAWARFKRNRLGYVSLLLFAAMLVGRHVRRAVSATTGRSSRATRASGSSRSSTTSRKRASAATSRRRPTGTIRSSASSSRKRRATSRCSPSTPTAASTLDYFDARRRPGAAGPASTGSAPTTPAATCVARLLYGFRVSVYFGLALTFVGTAARHPHRRAAGLLRRPHRPRHAARHRDLERDSGALPADHHRVDLRAVDPAADRRVRAVRLDRRCPTTCAPSSCATATSSS